MKIVRVTVEGGVVQNVEVPKGVRVIVKDYDVEGCDDDQLEQDEAGDSFITSVWESDAA